jgi:hypothetical protein
VTAFYLTMLVLPLAIIVVALVLAFLLGKRER